MGAVATTPALTPLTESERKQITARQRLEWLKCYEDEAYFIDTYVQIYDAVQERWIPFKLWRSQLEPLRVMVNCRLSIHLKARQIGMTWLALAYALHKLLFRPISTVLLFSKRDDEAMELLSRVKDMHARLPAWLQARNIDGDNAHEFELSNGSRALAFPTTAGDSYTATLVIGDEFDLVPNQDRLIASVKPTIDNGAQMILLSRPDKSRPQTRFKQIYRAAKNGENDWTAVFLPWWAHPGRDQVWYERIRADIVSSTGSEDELHEQYPATDTEALAPRTLDKRLAPAWLEQCYVALEALDPLPSGAPSVPGLRVYCESETGAHYVIGADPAEGNPTSDDSALDVVCRETGEQVATLAGKFQPSTFAAHIDAVGRYYNGADVLVERNNHGHAVLLWLREHSRLYLVRGHDGKAGWHNTVRGKALLYDAAADAYRHGETTLHDFATYTQLASIEGSTLRAPEGEHDDRADANALALAFRAFGHSKRARRGKVTRKRAGI